MPAKDIFHPHVREALEKDGWVIMHDPYFIETEKVTYPVDLGAEKMLAAEKENERIAIEIKSFLGASLVSEFHGALGQFLNYKLGLQETKSDRILYLAISIAVYEKMQELPIIMKSLETYQVKLLVFSPQNKAIVTWTK